MTKWKVPLYRVYVDKNDLSYTSKVIKRGMSWAIGPEIEEFESKLAKYVGTDYCLTFNSGTSAQHASLLALEIKPGNRVIVPSFTFISTANSVLMINAKPKFCDIEEQSLGLDPIPLEKSISKYVKAIMPIHYAGPSCQIEEICDIAKKNIIPVLENLPESLVCPLINKNIVHFGDIAIFSFAGNKIMTTGESGAIVTNSKKLYEKLKLIRSHGRQEIENYFQSNKKPDYVTLGYNWRMSSITAALALSQLKKLDKMISMRRKNANYLSSKLSQFEEITVPKDDGYKHAYQLYSIMLKNKKLRDSLMRYLSTKGIMSKIYFDPVHKTKFYKKLGYSTQNLPVTMKISQQILSLPIFPTMKPFELKLIANTINKFMKKIH